MSWRSAWRVTMPVTRADGAYGRRRMRSFGRGGWLGLALPAFGAGVVAVPFTAFFRASSSRNPARFGSSASSLGFLAMARN